MRVQGSRHLLVGSRSWLSGAQWRLILFYFYFYAGRDGRRCRSCIRDRKMNPIPEAPEPFPEPGPPPMPKPHPEPQPEPSPAPPPTNPIPPTLPGTKRSAHLLVAGIAVMGLHSFPTGCLNGDPTIRDYLPPMFVEPRPVLVRWLRLPQQTPGVQRLRVLWRCARLLARG
jgi:hypothetical protein